ncbi:MAG: preprotein translocase subunit SecA [Zavarzinella sp.]
MAEDSGMEMNFLEKIGAKFTAFGDGFARLLTRVFRTSNERYVRNLGFLESKDPNQPHSITPNSKLAIINALEPQMAALSDEELKGLTVKFRERLKNGESIEAILPEAFAATRESAKRTKNMRHYDVQIIGGIVLHEGNIAEMVTGEGKTLVATLPAYLNCLTEQGVHVITVNDYLARRDCEWMLPIFQALGVSAGFIQSDMGPMDRRKAYECDITYGTSSEFGFDYLRDNMKMAAWNDERFHPYHRQVQRKLHYAIIDEVDNILIDEARTPLIISGGANSDLRLYEKADSIARTLTDLENKARAELAAAGTPIDAPLKPGEKRELGVYFEVKEKERTVNLTDKGVREAERLAGVESFYTPGNMEWPHLLDNALKAHHLYRVDRDYMVMVHENEKKIIIIDQSTGRAMYGRQWSDGLHQAVEAKHKRDGVKIKEETQTLATVTLQNFFRLYDKLCGMTGTAMTEANEFWKIYKLDVIAIPTNRVMQRINHPDMVYRTDEEKWNAILSEIKEVHATGRPILVGTTDVAKSEKLAAMLRKVGIKYELLNAKPEYVARESEIVAQAGRKGAVTIATNMAGRGTDIILGGNPEYMAWAQLRHQYPSRLEVPEDVWKQTVDAIEAREKTKISGREIIEMGGLHIVGTERHESRRIDNQLRGRAGRQGDPGSSRFYLSLRDDLMRMYAGEWVANVLTRLGMKEGEAIESRMVTKRIQAAQKKIEEYHFESRKNLLEYDEVMDAQRKRIYGERQQILHGANPRLKIDRMIQQQLDAAIDNYLDENYAGESFRAFASSRLNLEFHEGDFAGLSFEDAKHAAIERASNNLQLFLTEAMEENLSLSDDPSDWKWQEFTRLINSRFQQNLQERDLKKIERDDLQVMLLEKGNRYLETIDLSGGAQFYDETWGSFSLMQWAQNKFHMEIPLTACQGTDSEVKQQLLKLIGEHSIERDIVYPVSVGMSNFMAESGSGERYNRAGLHQWALQRFPKSQSKFDENTFSSESRGALKNLLLEASKAEYPTVPQWDVLEQIEEIVENEKKLTSEHVSKVQQWMKDNWDLQLPEERFDDLKTVHDLQNAVYNLFDEHFRHEIHHMERHLLLELMDSAWKQHLQTMEHLKSGIGLWGYAQVDPKIKYKQEGMREFDVMWEGLNDRVTDMIFRIEETTEEAPPVAQQNMITKHESAGSYADELMQRVDDQQQTNSAQTSRPEPIRNSNQKVGRNDPCPCGSGKKYKNCHMKQSPKS